MTRLVDEYTREISTPIKSHPPSQAYRDNWDRTFGEKPAEPEPAPEPAPESDPPAE